MQIDWGLLAVERKGMFLPYLFLTLNALNPLADFEEFGTVPRNTSEQYVSVSSTVYVYNGSMYEFAR